jgi:hypothetical protein
MPMPMPMPNLLPAWLARCRAALHVRLRRRPRAATRGRTPATRHGRGARVRSALAPLSVPPDTPRPRGAGPSVGDR